MANANSQTITPQDQLAMAGQLRQEKMGGGEKAEPAGEVADKQPKTLREQIMAARRAMDVKQRAKDKVEEKVAAPIKKLSEKIKIKLLSLIPGYGIYIVFKQFVGKKIKIDLLDIIIILFSNLTAISVIAVILVVVILLVKIVENPAEAIDIFGFSFIWEAIKALF